MQYAKVVVICCPIKGAVLIVTWVCCFFCSLVGSSGLLGKYIDLFFIWDWLPIVAFGIIVLILLFGLLAFFGNMFLLISIVAFNVKKSSIGSVKFYKICMHGIILNCAIVVVVVLLLVLVFFSEVGLLLGAPLLLAAVVALLIFFCLCL